MSAIPETATRRFFAPDKVFGGTWKHPCLRGCGNEMVVPAPLSGRPRLEEGDIWVCNGCLTMHEYYLVLNPGSRQACVRLLTGVHRRENGEPSILEWVK